MRHHVVAFAVELLLAGFVKMKLQELILLASDGDKAPGCVVDLDGVTVVDDLERRGLVIKVNGRKVRLLRDLVTDIDRRLDLPQRAAAVFLFERSPLRRSGWARVAPVWAAFGGDQRRLKRQ